MRVQVTAFEMYEGHELPWSMFGATAVQRGCCGSSTFRRLFLENFDGYVRDLAQCFAIGAR
jgi:hypothetical protein